VNNKQIVYKIEQGMNPKDILCTTYQMRNFYLQFRDGYFTQLDVMNYIQHYKAIKMIKKGYKVLDVCCGRSLLLPMIRYHAKDIGEYTGIDISKRNIEEAQRLIKNKPCNFPHFWINANVAEMSKFLPENYFDFVIYTSSIEHMNPEDGKQSLQECFKVMKSGAIMFISCPKTEGDGYNTQYAAHIYEWGLKELKDELIKNSFKIEKEYGLVANKKELDNKYRDNVIYQKIAEYLPNEFLVSVFAIPYPEIAKEILLIVKK